MKRIGLFIGLVLSVLSVIGVYAADITRATYYGNLQITNNGSAATNQSATFTLNTTTLINAGFINASLNNTAILNDAGADTPFMPGFNGSNPWAVWVSSITSGVGGGNATLPYTLYTGGNQSMASNLRYFPGAAGMNTTDNASLELGANFTINQTAFIDTSAGANKTLVYKPGAITVNITGTGNITATINTSIGIPHYLLTPDGAGALTQIPDLVGAATHWQAVLTGDGNTSYVGTTVEAAQVRDLFTASNVSSSANISSVRIFIVAAADNNAAEALVMTALYTYNTTYIGDLINLKSGSANQSLGQFLTFNQTYTTNPNTGLAWTWQEINDLQIGAGTNIGAGGTYTRITQVYGVVYTPATVTAVGISSGNHTVTTSADSTNLSISVDGVLQATISLNGTTGVPNTAAGYQFFTANATPYVSNMTITINGTQQGRWEWQYGTTFTDLTGNGHTATPTFRTAGSSSNVTANLTSYTPYTQSTSTPTSPNASASNITIAFTQPSNLYSELNITMPGATWWNGVLDNANIPRAIFWFPWLFGWTCLIGLATHWLTKSLQVQGFVMGFLLILFSLMGGFGYWVAIEFIILALAFIIGEKQYGF